MGSMWASPRRSDFVELDDDNGSKPVATKGGVIVSGDEERSTKKGVLLYCDWCAVCALISFFLLAGLVALGVALIGDALVSTPEPTSAPTVAPTSSCNTTCLEICDSYCSVGLIEEEYYYSEFCRDMCEYHGDSTDECEYICYVRLSFDCKEDCETDCDC